MLDNLNLMLWFHWIEMSHLSFLNWPIYSQQHEWIFSGSSIKWLQMKLIINLESEKSKQTFISNEDVFLKMFFIEEDLIICANRIRFFPESRPLNLRMENGDFVCKCVFSKYVLQRVYERHLYSIWTFTTYTFYLHPICNIIYTSS